MSTRTTNPPSRAGSSISERAVRGAVAYRRTVVAKGASTAAPETENARVNDRRVTHGSAGDPQILRRWLVSELIAGATWRQFNLHRPA